MEVALVIVSTILAYIAILLVTGSLVPRKTFDVVLKSERELFKVQLNNLREAFIDIGANIASEAVKLSNENLEASITHAVSETLKEALGTSQQLDKIQNDIKDTLSIISKRRRDVE